MLEVYQGHSDYVSSLSFDGSFNLFSAAFDGSIKKWNMASRRVSFSFKSRIGSVTALAAIGNLLIGTKGSDIFSCSIDNASALKTLKYFNQSAISLIVFNGSFYAASLDGTLLRFSKTTLNDVSIVYNSKLEPLRSLTVNNFYLVGLKEETRAVFISRDEEVRTADFQKALVCIAATEFSIFAGSRSGVIYSWNIDDFELEQ